MNRRGLRPRWGVFKEHALEAIFVNKAEAQVLVDQLKAAGNPASIKRILVSKERRGEQQ